MQKLLRVTFFTLIAAFLIWVIFEDNYASQKDVQGSTEEDNHQKFSDTPPPLLSWEEPSDVDETGTEDGVQNETSRMSCMSTWSL